MWWPAFLIASFRLLAFPGSGSLLTLKRYVNSLKRADSRIYRSLSDTFSFILQVLRGVYAETLKVVSTMPEQAVYRQKVEQLTNSRIEDLNQVSKHVISCCRLTLHQSETIEAFEEKINLGQVEEIVCQVGSLHQHAQHL